MTLTCIRWEQDGDREEDEVEFEIKDENNNSWNVIEIIHVHFTFDMKKWKLVLSLKTEND